VPIAAKVMSSNPVHAEMYSIQHYVIKFVSDLRWVVGFLRILRFPPPINKTDCHDITEILLKVASNTTNHKPTNHSITNVALYVCLSLFIVTTAILFGWLGHQTSESRHPKDNVHVVNFELIHCVFSDDAESKKVYRRQAPIGGNTSQLKWNNVVYR
jgi:hypothetical protein